MKELTEIYGLSWDSSSYEVRAESWNYSWSITSVQDELQDLLFRRCRVIEFPGGTLVWDVDIIWITVILWSPSLGKVIAGSSERTHRQKSEFGCLTAVVGSRIVWPLYSTFLPQEKDKPTQAEPIRRQEYRSSQTLSSMKQVLIEANLRDVDPREFMAFVSFLDSGDITNRPSTFSQRNNIARMATTLKRS